MIQFNLLPDVKLEFVKAQRLKRLLLSISILVSAVMLFIFIVLLLYVDVAQKKHLTDLDSSISSSSRQLANDTNLNKILTVQNQLSALPALESQTPVASRLFPFLTEVTPASASIANFTADFGLHTWIISGSADSLLTVDQYVDTLKFTTYKTSTTATTSKPAFSNVVLSSFGYSNDSTSGQPASYTINLSFDPTIFNTDDDIPALTVPQKTTTRSVLEQPNDLFVANSSSQTSGGGQ